MKNKNGQFKKISFAVILVLLLAIVIIVAQNINEEISTTQENPATETQENTNLQTNNFETTNTETEITNNITETNNLCENINCAISTLICPDGFIVTCENSCVSETGACTSCTLSCEGHEQTTEQNQSNESGNETQIGNETETIGNNTEEGAERNETTHPEQNETIPQIKGEIITNITQQPDLYIQFLYPSEITRGEIIEIKAIVTNFGAGAKNILASWLLPEDFEVTSGNLIENCGNLNAQEFCTSAINIQTSISTLLGKNQIKITVSYENE